MMSKKEKLFIILKYHGDCSNIWCDRGASNECPMLSICEKRLQQTSLEVLDDVKDIIIKKYGASTLMEHLL